jgi:hypothetical protein
MAATAAELQALSYRDLQQKAREAGLKASG